MIDLTKVDVNIMGPPDIEREIGLTGGHIFQGDILPNFLWENRLSPSTPMQGNCTNKFLIFSSFFDLMMSSPTWICILYKKGFYMCGACTHPGGSVIGINGRNAAFQLFTDLSVSPKARSRL
jgi:phytoene dehydrogenase-like protein